LIDASIKAEDVFWKSLALQSLNSVAGCGSLKSSGKAGACSFMAGDSSITSATHRPDSLEINKTISL
jgi:hypothetical protein